VLPVTTSLRLEGVCKNSVEPSHPRRPRLVFSSSFVSAMTMNLKCSGHLQHNRRAESSTLKASPPDVARDNELEVQ
jgi:hypothetical protein